MWLSVASDRMQAKRLWMLLGFWSAKSWNLHRLPTIWIKWTTFIQTFKGKHINCTSEETWQGPKGSLINYEACIKHVAEINTHEKSEHVRLNTSLLCLHLFMERHKSHPTIIHSVCHPFPASPYSYQQLCTSFWYYISIFCAFFVVVVVYM